MRSASTTYDFAVVVLVLVVMFGLVVAVLPRVSLRSGLEAFVALTYGAVQWVVLDQRHDGRPLLRFGPNHGITTVDFAGIAPCAFLVIVIALRIAWHHRNTDA